jgi:ubiquinone/menaquinone biosynthesis C-methylase UbiE
MEFTKESLRHLYRKRARWYDWTANFYYLVGFREWAYRKKAVAELRLKPGGTVVEIACGTGLNFPLLQKAVGPTGKIIGVDMTDAMLEQARRRVKKCGWTNVELVLCDAAQYKFPQGIDGVISTCAITLIPEYDAIIRDGVAALAAGKRIVIFDIKEPANTREWLAKLGVWANRPFGVTRDLAARHPWESIEKYCANPQMEELFFGVAYIAAGEAR